MIIIAERNARDKKTLYELTKSPECKGMKDAAGTEVVVAAFVIFHDELKDCDVCCIKDGAGNVFGTNSRTFIAEFKDLVDIFGDELQTIKVITGRTKTGREYVTCTIA